MKLTYWVAKCLDDHECYSIRAKTRKKVVERVLRDYNPANFGAPTKVMIEYAEKLSSILSVSSRTSDPFFIF